jgi:hypothetical protein
MTSIKQNNIHATLHDVDVKWITTEFQFRYVEKFFER